MLYNKYENYTIIENEKQSQSSILPRTGIRQGSDPLESNLFNDVIMYIGDRTLEGELGLEKCIKKCDGMCVEYGMTCDAFCFPKTDYGNDIRFNDTINPELKNKSLI